MTVERKNGGLVSEEERKNKFPKGLRVLAVDDNATCLRTLEQFLRKCEYEVTTTTQAITALKMLRENRNRFDLVISDVEMPDMDGFKLLELLGLEMDLPVIMLSSYGDTNLVMKGISHGACDYLLKPVRLEELKNIWQHVIRKKAFGTKDPKMSSSPDKSRNESGQEVVGTSNANQNEKFSRKRKDQDEDEDEDGDEEDEENESEDPSAQKKPRVVWSVELHQKFVAAVNQLGIDKAVPKKILDLMDVEGLSRENVASHLQKYRLYLKRISSVTNQQANMDASYLRMASLDSFRDFRALTGSGRLSNTPQTSYYPPGMFSRLNTPTGLGLRGISSSASNPILPSIQNPNVFQGLSTLKTDFKPITENSSFAVPSKLGGSSNILLNNVPNNTLMLPRSTENTQSACGLIGNQFSGTLNPNPHFKISSSNYLDHGNSCSENWGSASQFSTFRSNSLPLSQPMLNHDLLNHNNLSERTGSSVPNTQFQINPNNFMSSSALSEPQLRAEMQNQAGLIDNVVQNMNYNSNHAFSNNLDMRAGTSLACLGQNSTVCMQNLNGDLMRQLNGCTPSLVQHNDAIRLDGNSNNKSPEDYLPQMQLDDGTVQNGFESLEDLMNSMIKRDQNEALALDGDFGFDPNSLGSFENLQSANFK